MICITIQIGQEVFHRSILPTILALARNNSAVPSMETFHLSFQFQIIAFHQLMGAATELSLWHKFWCQDLQTVENQQLLGERVDGSHQVEQLLRTAGWLDTTCLQCT